MRLHFDAKVEEKMYKVYVKVYKVYDKCPTCMLNCMIKFPNSMIKRAKYMLKFTIKCINCTKCLKYKVYDKMYTLCLYSRTDYTLFAYLVKKSIYFLLI